MAEKCGRQTIDEQFRRRADTRKAFGKTKKILDWFERELAKKKSHGVIGVFDPQDSLGVVGHVGELKNTTFLVKSLIQAIAKDAGAVPAAVASDLAVYLAGVGLGLIKEDVAPSSEQYAEAAKAAAGYILARYVSPEVAKKIEAKISGD